MPKYIATAPDGNTYAKESTRPITYGIAHLSFRQEEPIWIINSFSYGNKETAEKRMNGLKKFYQGEWAVVEAQLSTNG
jgi:hypothetical protein